jgi:hypothetical protein
VSYADVTDDDRTRDDLPAFEQRGIPLLERARESYSFGLVLLLILATVFWSAAAGDSDWALAVMVVLQGVTVLFALRTSDTDNRIRRVAAVVVGLAVASSLAALVASDVNSQAMSGAVSALLVAGTPVVMVKGTVRQLRRDRAVTLQTVFGVLSVYLLIGLFFASIYHSAAAIGDQPFFAQGIDGTRQNHLYFSFITLATVGYGDFTAASNFGRTVSMTEAILGQLYLVTAVSLVVGNLGRRDVAPKAPS